LCAQVSPQPAPTADSRSAKEAEPVRLSPFEVVTERDYGYQATSTVSGTRTNELLRDMPMSVTVLNKQFLEDIAATDPAAIFNFGLNVESINASGIGNEYGGGGNGVNIRGVQSSWNSRDGFIWYAISDNFDTESIEILRGPSGNIYGDGRVGGVMNIATKRAKLRDFGSLALRWDSESSRRATIDYNQRLNAKAGLRVNAMASDQRYWQDTAYDRRAGVALAFSYDFTKRTRFSTNIERNWVRRTNTRGMLTDGFSSGYVLGSGSIGAAAPAGTALLQAAGTTQLWTLVGDRLVNFEATPTTFFRSTGGIPAAAQTNVAQSIIPRHQQWNGPGDQLNHDSTAVNAALETQLGERTTLEFAFNLQLSDRLDRMTNTSSPVRDTNPQIPDGRGGLVANPNFDQLYITHRYTSSQYWNSVPSYRLTALHDFDFGFMTQRLITGVSLRDEKFRLTQRQEMLTPAAIAAAGLAPGTESRQTNNTIRRRFYLRDGNDDALDYHPRADTDFSSETPGGQKTHQPFYSGSALAIGRYWKGRVITTAGVRRDNFNVYATRVLTDATTGLGYLERDAAGALVENQTLNLWTTKWNYGGVFSPVKQFRVFWNYAENFQQNGSGVYFNGDSRLPRGGEGVDYGVSFYLFQDRVTMTATRFDNKGINETVTAIPNANVADEINRLLGTTYSTANPQDTRSRRTAGYEFELVTNITRQWSMAFKWSTRQLKNTDFAPRLAGTLAAMKAKTTDSSLYALTQAQHDSLVVENYNTGMQWNLTTRYSFTQGPLKGLRIGAYGYPRKERNFVIAGRPLLTYEGYFMANAFAGYPYKLMRKYRADVQLNVENLLNDQTRVGNSYTNNSYLAPIKFIVTHKFDF
jgi:outer membrane receptor for monomeric catechols